MNPRVEQVLNWLRDNTVYAGSWTRVGGKLSLILSAVGGKKRRVSANVWQHVVPHIRPTDCDNKTMFEVITPKEGSGAGV